jgi:hypothetical protein
VLAKCANPFCPTSFRHFRDGKLFRLEARSGQSARGSSLRRSRWFWLCGQCAANMTLTIEEEGAVVVVRRTREQEVNAVRGNMASGEGG